MIYPIEPRTRDRLASRFRAGDSVANLADDYGISPEQVEAALREEWTPSFAEAEARAAAEGACDCVESEVSRLREQVAEEHAAWAGVTEQWKHALGKLDEATEEIATLRLALGQGAPVAVLSPLSAYTLTGQVGEPYPVCQGCNRLVVECSCASKAETRNWPLTCPDCGCVWPLLEPGTETTVTCNCGKVLGCQSRRTTPPQAQASTPTISDEELDRR